MKRLILIAGLLLLLVLAAGVQPVYAGEGVFAAQTSTPPADVPGDETFVGVVVDFDAQSGTVQLEVLLESGDTVVYTVQMPEGYAFDTLAVGEVLEVSGTLGEDGVITPLLTEAETSTLDGGYYCTTPDAVHPQAQAIANEYGVEYTQVMEWFCRQGSDEGDASPARTGFGEIRLALETARVGGGDPDELLAMRAGGLGWGQIWKEMGYTGRPHQDDEPGGAEALQGNGSGHGNAHPGSPPDQAQNNKNKGKGKGQGKGKNK